MVELEVHLRDFSRINFMNDINYYHFLVNRYILKHRGYMELLQEYP